MVKQKKPIYMTKYDLTHINGKKKTMLHYKAKIIYVRWIKKLFML